MKIQGRPAKVGDFIIVEKHDPLLGKLYDVFDAHTFRLLARDTSKDAVENLLNLKLDEIFPKNINSLTSKRKHREWWI